MQGSLKLYRLLHATNSLIKNLDVIHDTLISPKKKKNDFTNVLVPKGEKVVPVTIKAILRNIANFFKGPVSRRKK